MASKNRVFLLGNLGRDPEIRYLPNGTPTATLSLATTEGWKDRTTGERKERTEWHRVVFFGRQAEIVGEYLVKGSQVDIEGKLHTRKWTDKEGVDHYTTEIIGGSLLMLGGKRREGAPEGEPTGQDDGGYVADDIPF